MTMQWLWDKTAAAVGLLSPLQQLQNAIYNKENENDASEIMKFVTSADTFSADDLPKAMELIKCAFWTQKSNEYVVTSRFKSLSAQNLSILIKKIGDGNVEKYIFEQYNKQILAHYEQNHLMYLLEEFYSDTFALFVFEQFKDYIKSPLLQRKQYLTITSIDVLVNILKYNNIAKDLHVEELIILFEKIKKYSNNSNGLDSKYQQIILSVTQQLITKNLHYIMMSNLMTIQERSNIIHQLSVAKLTEYFQTIIDNNSWKSISRQILSNAAKRIITQNVKLLNVNTLRIIFMNNWVRIEGMKIIVNELLRKWDVKKQHVTRVQHSINECHEKLTQKIQEMISCQSQQHDTGINKEEIHVLNEINKELKEYMNKGEGLRKDMDILHKLIKQIQSKIHEQHQQEKQNDIEGWKNKYNALKDECDENRDKYDKLQKEHESLRNKNNTLIKEGRDSINKYMVINNQNIKVIKENDELKRDKIMLKNEKENAEQQTIAISKEIGVLTKKQNGLLQERKSMEYTIGELQKMNNDLEDSNNILQQQEKAQLIQSGDQQQWIEKLSRELDEYRMNSFNQQRLNKQLSLEMDESNYFESRYYELVKQHTNCKEMNKEIEEKYQELRDKHQTVINGLKEDKRELNEGNKENNKLKEEILRVKRENDKHKDLYLALNDKHSKLEQKHDEYRKQRKDDDQFNDRSLEKNEGKHKNNREESDDDINEEKVKKNAESQYIVDDNDNKKKEKEKEDDTESYVYNYNTKNDEDEDM